MKRLEDYLALNYRMSLYRDEEGDYVAEIGELQGCVAHGSTPGEALESLDQAKQVWMESRLAAGLEIPEPRGMGNYSGKILVRMPRYLHQRLSEQATFEGVSLNQYVVSLLSDAAVRAQPGPLEAQNALAQALVSELRATGLRGIYQTTSPLEQGEPAGCEVNADISQEIDEEQKTMLLGYVRSPAADLIRHPLLLRRGCADPNLRRFLWKEVEFSSTVDSEEAEGIIPPTPPGA